RSRDGGRQAAIEEPVEIADAERAENENLARHARRPQRGALLDVGAGEQVRTGLLERVRDGPRAVPVRVGLHDGDRAGRPLAAFPRQMLDDVTVVELERVEIDPRNGGTDHESPTVT